MSKFKHLFSPIDIGNMHVKNRIFMSCMSTHLASEEGRVTDELLAYYEARARGGVGFITAECVLIEKLTRYATFRNMGLFDDTQIPDMRRLPEMVHKYGAKIGVQLLHPSTAAASSYNEGLQPVAASPVAARASAEIPRPLSVQELERIVLEFGQAARRAGEAGFDAVELHCCHRHGLLGNFLSPLHNKRVDRYGGNVDGRLQLPLEVLAEMRRCVGREFPIIVRMSATDEEPGGQSMMEARYIARRFEEAGASMIHMSDGCFDNPWNTTAPSGTAKAFNAELAAVLKGAVHIPIGFVGRINEPWVADMAIELGKGDAAYIGRALLCDPEFPNKAASDRTDTIRPCIGCLRCLVSVNMDQTICCTMNPEAGKEYSSMKGKTTSPKRVLVVGGGPAGLAAAGYAAERGHHVTLAEGSDRLGGQMYLAAFPPCKQDLAHGTKYLIEWAKKGGVDIQLQRQITQGDVSAGNYDAVIVATGGSPVVPGFLSGAKQLVSAWDALEGKVAVGKNIVIVGGGLVGCETADYLIHPHYDMSANGKRVTLIEMDSIIAREEKSSFRPLMIQRLLHKRCVILTGAKVEAVEGDTVRYGKDGTSYCIENVDTVVSAVGIRPENCLAAQLKTTGVHVQVIGDAVEARNIYTAITEAYAAVDALV